MKLLIVILNYKVTDLTIACLRSLSGEIATVPGTRVAVCENGTGPVAVTDLHLAVRNNNWANWCTVTSVYPNRGFCGGNNYILRAALASADPPEYVLLLNADTIVLPNALRTMVDFMEQHPAVGIAGSGQDNPDGTPQFSTFRFVNTVSEFDKALRFGPVSRLLKRWNNSPPLPERAGPVDWVGGSSMIIRRAVLDDIGLLDEDMYTYFDDIDFCYRAQRAGWPTWYVPESRIVHLEGSSTGVTRRIIKRRPTYWFEARRRFFLKNYGAGRAALADAANILGIIGWKIRRTLQRRPETNPPHWLGDFVRQSVFVKGFRVPVVQNPALRESAKVSDTESSEAGAEPRASSLAP